VNVSDGIHSTGCGIVTLFGVASQSPKDTLLGFLKAHPISNKLYVAAAKNYVDVPNMRQIHVIFGGPDMSTPSPTKGHDSNRGSCNAFADFLEEHHLGVVTRSPARHNPYHNERAEGEGDVTVYIWSPNSEAIAEWEKAHTI